MKFRKIFLIIVLFFNFLFFTLCSYSYSVSKNIDSSVFRLHIVANSDSDEDQSLKLKVRDAILSYINGFSFNSKEELIDYCNENKSLLQNIALSVIYENGFDYSASVEIGSFAFPTKTYGDVSLPAGIYDALQITLGNADGHNWWCVMFPPLCFVDVSSGVVPDSSKDVLEEELSSEEYELVSSDETYYTFKFKIVEFLNNLAMKF